MSNFAKAFIKAGKSVVTKLGPAAPIVGVVAATGGLAGIGVGCYFIGRHYHRKKVERAKAGGVMKKDK